MRESIASRAHTIAASHRLCVCDRIAACVQHVSGGHAEWRCAQPKKPNSQPKGLLYMCHIYQQMYGMYAENATRSQFSQIQFQSIDCCPRVCRARELNRTNWSSIKLAKSFSLCMCTTAVELPRLSANYTMCVVFVV